MVNAEIPEQEYHILLEYAKWGRSIKAIAAEKNVDYRTVIDVIRRNLLRFLGEG
jgi:hypothetical protein